MQKCAELSEQILKHLGRVCASGAVQNLMDKMDTRNSLCLVRLHHLFDCSEQFLGSMPLNFL